MTESIMQICGHGSGTPSVKNMYSYLESRYQSFYTNQNGEPARKGIVAVKRLKMMTDEGRKQFHDKYSEIIGRNSYSQNLRQFVYTPYGSRYYSDCSSSICATYQQIGYDVSLLNTAGIYNSNLFENVDVTIISGHIMDPDKLKVGDCILFAGNPGRPKDIGHVEAVFEICREKTYEEHPIKATLKVEATQLNVREHPDVESKIIGTLHAGALVEADAKSGEWFKTKKGWISRKLVMGWIQEENKKWWWCECGSYPQHCAKDINGEEYHFDRDGWMIDGERIGPSGAVIY